VKADGIAKKTEKKEVKPAETTPAPAPAPAKK
jgi:hypothetical protein